MGKIEIVTYEGLFAKCKTLAELRRVRIQLLGEAEQRHDFVNFNKFEIETAYQKRKEEISGRDK